MRWHPRDWIDDIPADFSDAGSFRHMRRFAQEELADRKAIRDEIVAQHDEQTAVEEWDSAFAGDDQRCNEAIALIDARMAKLGFTL
jgi:hypothetical protein